MAVQIVKPVDTGFPITPLTVEAGTETEDQFEWISLLCCTYGVYATHIDPDPDDDVDV